VQASDIIACLVDRGGEVPRMLVADQDARVLPTYRGVLLAPLQCMEGEHARMHPQASCQYSAQRCGPATASFSNAAVLEEGLRQFHT
jgi:hypothetical protein